MDHWGKRVGMWIAAHELRLRSYQSISQIAMGGKAGSFSEIGSMTRKVALPLFRRKDA